ncbi:DNA replication/repair protein RecF [Marinobacterium jannaschii]|uniref:DNA replication/repair protein RecF n=1 Tax=Marinobacterium jannaschii TaxID=64970 RepID=UPI000485BE94|nr:DNA replication/repair protein RecF [Marinobacterium jannaschii]
MSILDLRIQTVRNLSAVAMQPSTRINIICGENGSGKTSVLEAIHLLGLARSFRTSQVRHLIQSGQPGCVAHAQVDSAGHRQPLGVERRLDGDLNIRFAGENIDLSTLAGLLPLQVINSDTFQLLEGSPSIRRQFVDWGVFHADRRFIQCWRSFKRVLKQRNSLLKYGKIDHRMRQVWDREFVSYSEQLTASRIDYLRQLQPHFEAIIKRLLPDVEIALGFYRGWDRKADLDVVLEKAFQRELQQGFTNAGPQRADLRIKANGHSASERLSRGQKKLVVSALKLAQGALFNQMSSRPCIYLIDDLPSELDSHHSRLFCEFLEESSNQCFITCVDADALAYPWSTQTDVARFSIESGALSRV